MRSNSSGILLGPVWPAALLAKEVAGIDAVSGGRLTLGIAAGMRPDDFVAEGHRLSGRGKRFDQDLETFRSFWGGEPVGGGPNPGVTPGARQVPLLFGGMSDAAYARGAKWGSGYVGGSVPTAMVAQSFETFRAEWVKAGRSGSPRQVGLAYFALGDGEPGRSNVYDFYLASGAQFADLVSGNVSVGAEAVKRTVEEFAEIGATDLILAPTVGDLYEIDRLAEIVF
jgi:alkanesulfonate monooxygenase SsuD/methylene tetrahydromethanopterin reductase-like flavin-dependent oxidoreductase (luciferase family)